MRTIKGICLEHEHYGCVKEGSDITRYWKNHITWCKQVWNGQMDRQMI